MRKSAILFILIAAAASAYALPLPLGLSATEIVANVDALFIGSVPPELSGISPGAVTACLGASLPIQLDAPFFLEPRVDLYGADYEYVSASARAVPTTYEVNDGFFVAGMILSMQAGVAFPVSQTVKLGGAVGLDLLVRFPLDFRAGGADISDKLACWGYLWDKARFFYPETRIFVRWQIAERLGLVFDLRALYPVFHLWDGEGLPFLDQLIIGGGLGFAIPL